MKPYLLCFFLLSAAIARPVQAQDPAESDSATYTVLLENDRIRVLSYHDRPGEKTTMHHHPAFVLYALSDFERQVTRDDGQRVTRAFKTGDVVWMEAQTHIGENVGQTDTNVIIVEVKAAAAEEGKPKGPQKLR